jgi:hypothetical protein
MDESTVRLLWREFWSLDGDFPAGLTTTQQAAVVGVLLARVAVASAVLGVPGRIAAVWAGRAVGIVP